MIIAYFHTATPEHLEMLGWWPIRRDCRRHPNGSGSMSRCSTQPIEQRSSILVSWLSR